ncbi:MAG: DUF2203 domain-containing protein [Bacillus sp. (in: Bacteria)]|nr:DUF2203 domain-containing protein [Bacillus sp. (in: firmicutes)]
MKKKFFTVNEANQLLDTLETELLSLQNIQQQFKETYGKLKQLKDIPVMSTSKEDNIFKLESELEFLEIQGQLHMKNLENIGVELKSIELGLLDFPALIGGEEVLLCWKLGEKEVKYFHSRKDGYSGRRPLP